MDSCFVHHGGGNNYMYIIGLIDDEDTQLATMRRTIKVNAPHSEKYDFKSYSLSKKSGTLVEEVFQSVMQDIVNEKIACLIIDYKIMVKTVKIKGTDIFKKIKDVVPQFPVIILTEVVKESMEPYFIDADKVYRKFDFFKLKEEYSKDKVKNIFDSMHKYTAQKDALKVRLLVGRKELIRNSGADQIRELLKVEKEISEFLPIGQTQIDKVFNQESIKRIVAHIEKANEMLVQVDEKKI